MAKPKEMFYVEIKPRQGSGRVGYYKKGGGKYTSMKAAEAQRDDLARQGVVAVVYAAKVEWEPLPVKHFHLPMRREAVGYASQSQMVERYRCNCGLDVVACRELDGKEADPTLF